VFLHLYRHRKLEKEVEEHKLFEDYLRKVLGKIPKGRWLPYSLSLLWLGHSV
jgi:hypothetical protein